MPIEPPRPTLFEINTRVYLNELSKKLNKTASLDDVPDSLLLDLANKGFDFLWFLGVWQIGLAGKNVSRSTEAWQQSFRNCLPDLTQADITGSPFAIKGYEVDSILGGPEALARLRKRMQAFNLKLCLDFVPNHTALDHPWVETNPDFYMQGSEVDLQAQPENYIKIKSKKGEQVFAYGRDPYFSGWPDTLQLNYFNAKFQTEMKSVLKKIASQCDALRCDMAMLVLSHVFKKTWGTRTAHGNNNHSENDFWSSAIKEVKSLRPEFKFIAEAYWDLEWELQQQGFDYTYDKRLYDRLAHENAMVVNLHLQADWEYSQKMVRFLENHDEKRAADVFFTEKQCAAAVITFFAPGLLFFHEGQFEGWKKHASVHLNRRPEEKTSEALMSFYTALLISLKNPEIKTSAFHLLYAKQPYENDISFKQFVCALRISKNGKANLAIVNYGPSQAQCFLPLPLPEINNKTVTLNDKLSPNNYEREGSKLTSEGLYLNMQPWGYHLFEISIQQ
jgi:hypothetical protein